MIKIKRLRIMMVTKELVHMKKKKISYVAHVVHNKKKLILGGLLQSIMSIMSTLIIMEAIIINIHLCMIKKKMFYKIILNCLKIHIRDHQLHSLKDIYYLKKVNKDVQLKAQTFQIKLKYLQLIKNKKI